MLFLKNIIDFFKKFSQHRVMQNRRYEKENIIKDIKNIFILRKELS